MKPRFFLLIPVLLFAASCENTWDGESKELFHQSCMEDALTWAPNQDKAKVYCDCTLERIMKKYPKMSDAMEHIDSVISDPNVKGCKEEVLK
jgi:hypothetical protein